MCGLAYDYCVGSTAESAAKAGFKTKVVVDATRSVNERSHSAMKARLDKLHVTEVKSIDYVI